jgi:hypothetical protein
VDINETIKELQAELDALPEQQDVEQNYRAQAAYAATQSRLHGTIRILRESARTLAEIEPKLATAKAALEVLDLKIRTQLSSEMLGEQDYGKRHNLSLSLAALDKGGHVLAESGYAVETCRLGALLREAGVPEIPPTDGRVHGTLVWTPVPVLKATVARLTKKLHELQERIDILLAEHDARRDMQKV